MPESSAVQRGLQDVVALESRICFIDGKLGRLIYQGYDIRDLAARSTFEEVAYLLWYGRLPSAEQLADLKNRFGQLRILPEPLVERIDQLPIDANPMDILRTAVSALALFEPEETKPGASSIGIAVSGSLLVTLEAVTIIPGMGAAGVNFEALYIPFAPLGAGARSYYHLVTTHWVPIEDLGSAHLPVAGASRDS